MGLLSVFANFRIDSEERFLRMQDSFISFCGEDIEKWVINIRGPYKREAGEFLQNHLGSTLILFDLESGEGWFHDSRRMLDDINSDYVFFWIEDHININRQRGILSKVVAEMKANGVESLWYSCHYFNRAYRNINRYQADSIEWFELNLESFKKVLAVEPCIYIIACISILENKLFKKNITTDDTIISIKWPKETPFEFEKCSTDLHWLPIRCATLKEEMFVSIDDDHGQPRSSLISRGLYPDRISRYEVGIAGGCLPTKNNVFMRAIKRLKLFMQSKVRNGY